MIGTPVECTLWKVDYDYRDPQKPAERVVVRGTLLVSADPSGADLYDVVQRAIEAVAGRAIEDLHLDAANRITMNVRGLANVGPCELQSGGLALAMLEVENSNLRAELENVRRVMTTQAAELRRLHALHGYPTELPDLDAQPTPATDGE